MSYDSPSNPFVEKKYDGNMHRVNLNHGECYELPLRVRERMFGNESEIKSWEDLRNAHENVNRGRFDGFTPFAFMPALAEKIGEDLGIPRYDMDRKKNYKLTQVMAYKEIERIHSKAREKSSEVPSDMRSCVFKKELYSPLYDILYKEGKVETDPSVADEITDGELMFMVIRGS